PAPGGDLLGERQPGGQEGGAAEAGHGRTEHHGPVPGAVHLDPARNAASWVLNSSGLALSYSTGLKSASVKAESMSAKCMSGLSSAAAWMVSSRLKPTPMVSEQPACTIASTLPVYWPGSVDSASRSETPSSSLARIRPLYPDSLKEASSQPPSSETMQARKSLLSPPSALPSAPVWASESAGSSSGADPHAASVSAAAATRAAGIDFFTS